MSELPFADDDSDEPDLPSRGRALWAFAALASAAVIIVALMVFLLGDPGGSNKQQRDQLAIPGGTSDTSGAVVGPTHGAQTSTSSSPPTTSSSAPSSSSSSSGSASHTAPRTSCPSNAPCVSPGDPGDVIAAINAYRRDHGVPAASGTVISSAQKCALQEGDQSACPASYAWEPVETATGTQVIEKVVARGGGGDWLLDPKTESFAVGWAFVPAAHGGGHYSCAIVKLP
jgi:hypothetical protein